MRRRVGAMLAAGLLVLAGCGDDGGGGGGGAGRGSQSALCPVVGADAYSAPSGDACNLVTQTCPAGQGCYVDTGGRAACGSAGSRECQMPCGVHGDCLPGLLCVEAAEGFKTCAAPCSLPGSCAAGATCQSWGSRGDIGVCLAEPDKTCSLIQQGCPDGQGCYRTFEGIHCVAPTEAPATIDEPCQAFNDCQPGLVCLALGEDGPRCRLPCLAHRSCGELYGQGAECKALDDPLPYSVCVPPQG